ncbi:hypothetical protein [Pseudomonas sp. KNUC1026]|uniref:hypothetical protein n=1 Tax=Pseudomonas sp. KNUC1026 TaxID=2893890 RepID=UPI001F3FE0AD|nr:hypothetical protein [Pseudomonas sp. KNUC1026]UFH51804.1 hypothetical protein LN139_21090 [Pseudomonas sp. KNUC1026]
MASETSFFIIVMPGDERRRAGFLLLRTSTADLEQPIVQARIGQPSLDVVIDIG